MVGGAKLFNKQYIQTVDFFGPFIGELMVLCVTVVAVSGMNYLVDVGDYVVHVAKTTNEVMDLIRTKVEALTTEKSLTEERKNG